MLASGRNGYGIGLIGGHVGLARGVSTPSYHRTVPAQRDAMDGTGSNAHHAAQTGRNIGLADIIRAPGQHGAGFLEQQVVISAASQCDHVSYSVDKIPSLSDATPPDRGAFTCNMHIPDGARTSSPIEEVKIFFQCRQSFSLLASIPPFAVYLR